MATDFGLIRSWDGSKDRAFEELCYQLRDPTPTGAQLIKTGDPDGGLEWYVQHSNGVEWGWQAKYSFEIDKLLKLMEKSLKTVVNKRPTCRRLTFCIPIDLPDAPGDNERKSARQKFEDRKESWRERIPGASRVSIGLLSEGALLDRLTAHPNERGITWFFWDREVFSRDWLRKRLSVTVKAAGERYSPELHVNLPVAFALEGLAGSPLFWSRYRERRAAAADAIADFVRQDYTGIGVTAAIRRLHKEAAAWEAEVPDQVRPPGRLPSTRLLALSRQVQDAISSAYPESPPARRENRTEEQAKLDDRRNRLRHYLTRLSSALTDFSTFLRAGAGQAAERGALLLTGEAGQGKTHLFCDVGERAVSDNRPAIVLLGGQLSGSRFWSDCAERLGLAQVGGEALLGGMRAAAQASNGPFLLLLDALNESAVPSAWSSELPALLAELDEDPWISLGASVRSTFLHVVLPEEGVGDSVAEVDHGGFQGRELEAMERFFDAFGLEQPRVPLLIPEFTNPLFLKLYCEGLKQLGLNAPPVGEAHISDVFARHLEWKSRRIAKTLELDPAERRVEQAIERFSEELAAQSAEHLPRQEAADLVNGFAPHLHQWPRTMLGQLLSEGLLAQDVAWTRDSDDPMEVVRFVYQRFADYRIAGALLDPFDSPDQLRQALRAGQRLREKIYAAPPGWIEALSVLVPERFGIELLDATNWRFKHRREWWERALARSVVSRRPEAMTDRARALLSAAEQRSRYLADAIFEAVLSVAPIPSHPLNADYLHCVLTRRTMADRDASWGVATYYALGSEGPIDRLIRWAARGPYPECPDEVLRLAGTLLAWTFASPNRFMRDYATKAMRQLIASRPAVLEMLVTQFASVDDPYVTERLAVVVHGSLLADGNRDPGRALRLARHLRDTFLVDEALPNILTRDAVRGSFEWALRAGLVDSQEYQSVVPPYGSAPPEKPRTKKQLEKAYDRDKRDRDGNYIGSPYARLFSSLFDLGDFGRYVAESALSRFTTLPLADAQRNTFDGQELAASLSGDELRKMLTILDRPALPSATRITQYPGELGARWIFERVLSLGWTPERFADFEDMHLREGAGRSGHKAERFGKKYQWIALRELIARIADNFHMRGKWSNEERAYRGPWQFYGRDIDPTLPPPPRYRDGEEDAVRMGSSFQRDPPGVWWDPGGPRYLASDPVPPDHWATQTGDIPQFESLVRRVDDDGRKWIALQAYYNWDEVRIGEGRHRDRPKRYMWSHIYAWLIPSVELQELVSDLTKRSFMGRWMPEAGSVTDAAYLAEMPWAEAANEYPRDWQPVQPQGEEESRLEVLPAWEGYTWEGGIWDCSLEESVHASLPNGLLFDLAELERVPDTRSWRNRSGTTVAQFRSRQGEHSVLLVRESWLKTTLEQGGWGLAIGWLGEKTLYSPGWAPGFIGGWTEMNGVASFGKRGFRIAAVTTKQVSRGTDGAE